MSVSPIEAIIWNMLMLAWSSHSAHERCNLTQDDGWRVAPLARGLLDRLSALIFGTRFRGAGAVTVYSSQRNAYPCEQLLVGTQLHRRSWETCKQRTVRLFGTVLSGRV
jgi:hypothetical protein